MAGFLAGADHGRIRRCRGHLHGAGLADKAIDRRRRIRRCPRVTAPARRIAAWRTRRRRGISGMDESPGPDCPGGARRRVVGGGRRAAHDRRLHDRRRSRLDRARHAHCDLSAQAGRRHRDANLVPCCRGNDLGVRFRDGSPVRANGPIRQRFRYRPRRLSRRAAGVRLDLRGPRDRDRGGQCRLCGDYGHIDRFGSHLCQDRRARNGRARAIRRVSPSA